MRSIPLLSVALLATGAAVAQEGPSLKVGDPAPAYDIAHWVKGDPVAAFEPGSVYVMEFWATWCPPCRASIPHLSELQEKYAGKVTIIGVSDEELQTVADFLGQPEWQDKTHYRLCTDPDRSTHKAWMEAAGQTGIPTAFVVKDRRIQWIGHPMEIDDVIASVVDGSWSIEAYQEEMVLREQLDSLGQRYGAAGEEERPKILAEVLGVMDQLVKAAPRRNGHFMLSMFQIRLVMLEQPEKAWAMAPQLVETNWHNAAVLGQFAWMLATDANIRDRHLDLALKAAERAVALGESKDADTLDTLARVRFVRGEREAAVAAERQALELATDERQKQAYQKNLDEYQGAQP